MPSTCGCSKNKSAQPFVVVLPGGEEREYRSSIAAEALVKRTAGAYVKPPASAPLQ